MTAEDILDAVRVRLNDVDGQRYTASVLLADLNAGCRALFSRRPDCVILDTDETIRIEAPSAAEAEADVIAIHDRFAPALVAYVLSEAYAIDSDDAQAGNPAGLAAFHKATFDNLAMTL